METTVICPDCGGVIGSARDGHKPCTCDQDESNGSGSRPGMPEPAVKVKVCCKCGKDLAGKKRFKDSLGYWCEACHYEEKREQKGDQVPCDSCGRYVQPTKLIPYESLKICSRCLKDRKDAAKKIRRPVVFGSEHRAHERKTLLTMGAVAGALLLIIVLKTLGWLG